jgi:hypothetical protein
MWVGFLTCFGFEELIQLLSSRVDWGMGLMVEQLPDMQKASDSFPSMAKKKKKKKVVYVPGQGLKRFAHSHSPGDLPQITM